MTRIAPARREEKPFASSARSMINRRAVIPGRAVSANPESSRKDKTRGWIPGPACGRPGMTPPGLVHHFNETANESKSLLCRVSGRRTGFRFAWKRS
jgi:hypothetical protein